MALTVALDDDVEGLVDRMSSRSQGSRTQVRLLEHGSFGVAY
jgi:predicted transcriptional regulator